jgi:pilus assembly protein CpaE
MGAVVLCDRDQGFIERIGTVLQRDGDYQVTIAPTLALAREAARREHALVVVMGPSVAIDAAIAVGEELAALRPPVSVVLVAQRVTTDLLRQALRAGMRDVLSASDQTDGEVVKSVRDAYDSAMAWQGHTAVDDTQQTAAHQARIITVFSTKGGVGKSVLATNLAVALAADKQLRVVLVDLDLASGDDGIMLNLRPAHTIFDAAQAIDRLDTELLKGLLVPHGSGVNALLAPLQPEDADMVTAAKVGRILDLTRQIADVVVIDTPGAIDEVVLTAIDKSDIVLAVATLDMPSVKNMRVSLQKLAQLGYADGLVQLVLNRADSKVLMDISDVEEALSGRVSARIPSDRLVPRSVNKGVPIVTDAPRSGVARAIIQLAETVAADKEAK